MATSLKVGGPQNSLTAGVRHHQSVLLPGCRCGCKGPCYVQMHGRLQLGLASPRTLLTAACCPQPSATPSQRVPAPHPQTARHQHPGSPLGLRLPAPPTLKSVAAAGRCVLLGSGFPPPKGSTAVIYTVK